MAYQQQQQDQIMMIGAHAQHSFEQVAAAGPAARPLDFPPPRVRPGVRVNALVVHPESGSRQVCSGVIHREDVADVLAAAAVADNGASYPADEQLPDAAPNNELLAYWPQRRLQDAIYGSVWVCLVLKRHVGLAADDAARAAGMEPGSIHAPLVWEITGRHAAVKMVEWARVHQMRGRLLEDPVKEVSALQMLSHINTTTTANQQQQRPRRQPHPNVLTSTEVLQDGDFLYSIMPYCRDGDLFGIVVQYAEESGGEIGMPEPVARFWFRQILWGIHHLQREGVCHRDLSLENILVDGDRCMVMDMGMCLRVPYNDNTTGGKTVVDVTRGTIRRLMKPQGVCGKHNYMSPEVLANSDNFDGFAIDVWAAGVILYIMLTGFPPYDQANLTDRRFDLIVNGHLNQQLRTWGIHLSDEAGHLLQSMLRLDPRQRLTLAQVLEHPWVTNGPVQPPPANEPLPFH